MPLTSIEVTEQVQAFARESGTQALSYRRVEHGIEVLGTVEQER
jgi:hypothetical protein